jgi:hypothetical protein
MNQATSDERAGFAFLRESGPGAQVTVGADNYNLRHYQQLQGAESEDLQTSQQALAMREQLRTSRAPGRSRCSSPPGRTSCARTRSKSGPIRTCELSPSLRAIRSHCCPEAPGVNGKLCPLTSVDLPGARLGGLRPPSGRREPPVRAGSLQVARRLWAIFEWLSAVLPPQRLPALHEEWMQLHRAVERAFYDPEDRTQAEERDDLLEDGVIVHHHPSACARAAFTTTAIEVEVGVSLGRPGDGATAPGKPG